MGLTLARLEREGLVSRCRSETDTRRIDVGLTVEGRRRLDAAVKRARALEDALAAELEDPDALRRALLTLLRARTADGIPSFER
jgi:DNA-binding MarR family transcriptional regulator